MSQGHWEVIEWFLKHNPTLVSDKIPELRQKHWDQLRRSNQEAFDLIQQAMAESSQVCDESAAEDEAESEAEDDDDE